MEETLKQGDYGYKGPDFLDITKYYYNSGGETMPISRYSTLYVLVRLHGGGRSWPDGYSGHVEYAIYKLHGCHHKMEENVRVGFASVSYSDTIHSTYTIDGVEYKVPFDVSNLIMRAFEIPETRKQTNQ